jgi:hypothetical protein
MCSHYTRRQERLVSLCEKSGLAGKHRGAGTATVCDVDLEPKAVIRLTAGPADGLVFAVPAAKIPPFVAVEPVAKYERAPSDGEVICYRFAAEDS